MTENKRFTVFKSPLTRLFVVNDELHEFNFEGVENASTIMKLVGLLNNALNENEQLKKENKWLKSIHFTNDVLKENKLLKDKLNEILELTEMTGMIHLRKAEIKSIIKR